MTRQKGSRRLAGMLLALAVWALPSVLAQIDCAQLAHWTNFPVGPQVNQVHVFCGEFSNGAPKGFHSRPGGLTPATVQDFQITQPANAQGIYGGTWYYAGHPGVRKFSTMFPDACSQADVLNSIRHAAANPVVCPPNAPNWAWCGPNRPNDTGAGFCNAANNTIFIIAGASLGNGNINTAFPLM